MVLENGVRRGVRSYPKSRNGGAAPRGVGRAAPHSRRRRHAGGTVQRAGSRLGRRRQGGNVRTMGQRKRPRARVRKIPSTTTGLNGVMLGEHITTTDRGIYGGQ